MTNILNLSINIRLYICPFTQVRVDNHAYNIILSFANVLSFLELMKQLCISKPKVLNGFFMIIERASN